MKRKMNLRMENKIKINLDDAIENVDLKKNIYIHVT